MKKLKRILAISLSALLLVGVMSISAFAADDEVKLSLAADNAAAAEGEEVKVDVALAGTIGGATLHLKYDTEYFECVDAEAAKDVVGDVNKDVPGDLILSCIANEIKDTTLMTATFKVLKAGGELTLTAEQVIAADKDGTDITAKAACEGLKLAAGEAKPADETAPKTGDSSNVMLWMVLAAAALGAAAFAATKKNANR